MKWEWRSSRTVVLAIAMAAFAVFCVAPVAYMLGIALTGARAGQLGATLLLDVRQRSLLYNTALLGVGTAILSTLVGAPLGLALARIPIPAKPALRRRLGLDVSRTGRVDVQPDQRRRRLGIGVLSAVDVGD
jgi:ABC-type Fe3+ transport system permease subunit